MRLLCMAGPMVLVHYLKQSAVSTLLFYNPALGRIAESSLVQPAASPTCSRSSAPVSLF